MNEENDCVSTLLSVIMIRRHTRCSIGSLTQCLDPTLFPFRFVTFVFNMIYLPLPRCTHSPWPYLIGRTGQQGVKKKIGGQKKKYSAGGPKRAHTSTADASRSLTHRRHLWLAYDVVTDNGGIGGIGGMH